MNDPTDLPFDRVPLTPPSRSAGLLDPPAVPALPPPRPSVSVAPTPPKPAPDAPAEAAKEAPADPPAGSPPPQPRWVKEALRDLLRPNRRKGVVAAAAGGLVTGALVLNAVFSGSTPPPAPELAA